MHNLKALALAISICTASAAFGQNLILNGSFEAQGAVGFTIGTGVDSSSITNWSLQTTSGTSAFTIFAAPGSNEPNPAHGSFLLNIGGFGTGKGVGLLWQDFATIPGDTYDVALYFGRGNNDSLASDFISLRASAFNIVSGSPSGSALNFTDSGSAPATGAVGNLSLVGFQFVATGTTSRLLLNDTSVSSGNSVHLDNVAVIATSVPEPSTALLAVSGGAILLARRRRTSF